MRGVIYSQDLGIDLKSGTEQELFKWFLACLLFGKPIQQHVAERTYFEFEKAGIVSLDTILNAGWHKLVSVLDKGHYVRYDYSTASKLLSICKQIKKKYGSLGNLMKESEDMIDLKRRLEDFDGIGPVTARIFVRDVRKYLRKGKGARRIFVAIKVSPIIQGKVINWMRQMPKIPVRWVYKNNLHITLIPPWQEDDVEKIKIDLQSLESKIKSFDLHFSNITLGPNMEEPRLIWVMGEKSKELLGLRKKIAKILDKKVVSRSFKPHLTIARFFPTSSFLFLIKEMDEKINWEESVASFELIESSLFAKGRKYKTLLKINLIKD